VHSEVYLNKYVVSIVPFSTPAFTSTPIQKTAFFACFRFLFFHPFFQGEGSADPICPYVRTPMDRHAVREQTNATSWNKERRRMTNYKLFADWRKCRHVTFIIIG